MVAVELLAQVFRVVAVDEHERSRRWQGREPVEDQRVALRFRHLPHV
jgi:hypothetical protein